MKSNSLRVNSHSSSSPSFSHSQPASTRSALRSPASSAALSPMELTRDFHSLTGAMQIPQAAAFSPSSSSPSSLAPPISPSHLQSLLKSFQQSNLTCLNEFRQFSSALQREFQATEEKFTQSHKELEVFVQNHQKATAEHGKLLEILLKQEVDTVHQDFLRKSEGNEKFRALEEHFTAEFHGIEGNFKSLTEILTIFQGKFEENKKAQGEAQVREEQIREKNQKMIKAELAMQVNELSGRLDALESSDGADRVKAREEARHEQLKMNEALRESLMMIIQQQNQQTLEKLGQIHSQTSLQNQIVAQLQAQQQAQTQAHAQLLAESEAQNQLIIKLQAQLQAQGQAQAQLQVQFQALAQAQAEAHKDLTAANAQIAALKAAPPVVQQAVVAPVVTPAPAPVVVATPVATTTPAAAPVVSPPVVAAVGDSEPGASSNPPSAASSRSSLSSLLVQVHAPTPAPLASPLHRRSPSMVTLSESPLEDHQNEKPPAAQPQNRAQERRPSLSPRQPALAPTPLAVPAAVVVKESPPPSPSPVNSSPPSPALIPFSAPRVSITSPVNGARERSNSISLSPISPANIAGPPLFPRSYQLFFHAHQLPSPCTPILAVFVESQERQWKYLSQTVWLNAESTDSPFFPAPLVLRIPFSIAVNSFTRVRFSIFDAKSRQVLPSQLIAMVELNILELQRILALQEKPVAAPASRSRNSLSLMAGNAVHAPLYHHESLIHENPVVLERLAASGAVLGIRGRVLEERVMERLEGLDKNAPVDEEIKHLRQELEKTADPCNWDERL